jgi:hypothetical protein
MECKKLTYPAAQCVALHEFQGFGSGSVSGSGSAWIRINLSCWIRIRIKPWIRIRNPDPQIEKMLDPDPYPDTH